VVPVILHFLVWALLLLCATAVSWFAIASWREGEARAVWVALIGGLATTLPLAILATVEFPGRVQVVWVLLGLFAALIIMLLWPDRRAALPSRMSPTARIDERDTMFSRRELRPGSARYTDYYERHPQLEAVDRKWRSKPGLMSSDSRYAHRFAFAASDGSFSTIEALHALVDATPSGDPVRPTPQEASRFLLSWSRKLGALDAGITSLSPLQIYSTAGRGDRYDQMIDLDHPFALAFTVEMDHDMMQSAPAAATLMESAHQYLNSGAIAVQIANTIGNLGYRARAHVDGNYQVICPLVARDAGLGEIGRMGLLMTPEHGPRVRIGIVTTDMPLVPTARRPQPSVEDFCDQCEKCARLCPSQAIPYGRRADQQTEDRWRIDSESCFGYWCDAGTDCARCMITCPYSHPDTALHRLVRVGIRKSPLLRRIAAPLDDLAYGRRPAPKALPQWLGRSLRED